MRQIAIQLNNVSKTFWFWQKRPETLKSFLVELISGKIRLSRRKSMVAVKNINLTVHKGEFIGIMGRNGAGKSTLFKMMCGIYKPNSGTIQTHGVVAPLIELGAGFNPDLSGYENIYLNAAILGFGKKVTEEALPKIVEFCELGESLGIEVKKYSSGMLMRLGFAIATHLPADILLCDEILAVGDLEFQRKCIDRIRQLHAQGKTILLTTHDLEQVRKFCQRCVIVNEHEIYFDGAPEKGILLLKQLLHVEDEN